MVLWHKKVPSDTRGYKIAENAGALLSFDPNLRESLWNDLAEEEGEYPMDCVNLHCSVE